jgi:hypothetical protein
MLSQEGLACQPIVHKEKKKVDSNLERLNFAYDDPMVLKLKVFCIIWHARVYLALLLKILQAVKQSMYLKWK